MIIWGCLPKINPASLKDVYDGPLIGPEECWDFFHNYFSLPKENNFAFANKLNENNLLMRACAHFLNYTGMGLLNFRKGIIKKNIWYIKIVHGCKNSCTYCSDRLAYKTVKSQSIPPQKYIHQVYHTI